MFKLMIVDDEHIVRMALRSLIDWHSNGIEIVAECANGQEALSWLSAHPVDLVLTDVNMPIMNGLELIQAMQHRGLTTPVIVLSAYNDYDYVRQAFKFGVTDYILKSELDPKVILALVMKTFSNLSRLQRAQAVDIQAPPLDHYFILKSMAEGVEQPNAATYSALVAALGFKSSYACCVMLVDDFAKVEARYTNQETAASTHSDLGVFAKHVLESTNFQLLKEQAATAISISPSTYLILYGNQQSSQAANQNKLELTLRSIQKSLKVYLDITVSIGVISQCQSEGLRQLYQQYLEALALANLRYLYGKGRILHQSHAQLLHQIAGERIVGQEVALIEAIKALDPVRVDQALDQLLNKIATFKSQSITQLLGYYLELMLLINLKCSELDPDIHGLMTNGVDFHTDLKQYETKEEIHQYIRNYVHLVLQHLSKASNHSESSQIKRAKKYMVQHYMEDIGLTEVAEHVELSESYLSKLFVTETGETFIHFLTRYRINKACELLTHSNLKIYEVSKQVGYDNVEHFSRIFKKAIGFSPIDYKKQRYRLV